MQFKYDVLKKLKKNLYCKYTENTAKTYYNEVKNALNDQQFASVKEINVDKVLEYCKNLKVKSRVSAVKQGLMAFKDIDRGFKVDEYAFNDITKSKRNRRVKKFEPFKLSTALRRINKLDDMKLKIAYRLMFVTGLRVAEVAILETKDIKIKGDRLIITVKGKGNKERTIKSIPDKYLVDKISKILEDTKDGSKLFYSSSYMMEIAHKNQFHCHDLRRASSQIIYNSIDDGQEAIEATQKHLGHSPDNTIYKKYISRNVDFKGTRFEKGGFKLE